MGVGLTREQLERHFAVVAERERQYNQLVSELAELEPGEHEIEVADIEFVEIYAYDGLDQEVIIRDTEGRLFLLTETLLGFSRHDVKPGTRFRLTVRTTVPRSRLPSHISSCTCISS
jgi:hypothetical protein